MAPFRLQWLEALSEYLDVVVYHLNDYDNSVNAKYLDISSDKIEIKTDYIDVVGKKFFRYSKILNENADMILLDGYGFVGQVFLIAYLRIHKVDFYMTVDGGLLPNKENKTKRLIKQFCLNGPKAILSTSEITDSFINHYKTSDAPVVRHYFSSIYLRDVYRPKWEEKAALKRKLNLENKFSVLAVGRFIHVKGFDILLKTAELFDSDVCFVFVGGIPPKEYLDIARKNSSNNIRFVDFLNKNELKDYYYACDVFALPSRGDVWGLVVGEAMSCGLPVISSNKCIAGASMIKNYVNGFVVYDEQPESYYSRIEELNHNRKLLETMADNNCEVMKKYALDVSVIHDIKNFECITGITIKEE